MLYIHSTWYFKVDIFHSSHSLKIDLNVALNCLNYIYVMHVRVHNILCGSYK